MISDYDRLRKHTRRVDEGVNEGDLSDGRVTAKRTGEKISDGGVNIERADERVRDRSVDTDEDDKSVTDEGVDVWFAREAPSIVAGLEASQFIGPVTAETARTLIASGCAEEALNLVLGEVDESWRE